MSGPEPATLEQIMAKIEYDTNGGCWLWSGGLNDNGYGRLERSGKRIAAHRYIYENLIGPIPGGLEPDHLCRVRCCVNPDHLEPITGRENTLRGVGPTAINAAKTECGRGHPFSPENTYLRNGWRICRECQRSRDHAYKQRLAALNQTETEA